MNGAKKGDAVKVDIIRDKKKRTLSATLDSDGDMQMSWGPGQGGFQFDFGQGVNPFAPQGNGQGLFGQGFPFNHGSFGSDDMQERMQELEQRLQELEGRSSPLQTLPRKSKPGKAKQAPGASTPGASKDKPFRSAPGVGAGTSS